jgi:hypothetical protein
MVKEFLSLTNFSCISMRTEPMEEFLSTVPQRGVLLRGAVGTSGNPFPSIRHSPLSLYVQGEGCFRRKRESSFVLLARLLLCRRERGEDNEVLLVGSLTD